MKKTTENIKRNWNILRIKSEPVILFHSIITLYHLYTLRNNLILFRHKCGALGPIAIVSSVQIPRNSMTSSIFQMNGNQNIG